MTLPGEIIENWNIKTNIWCDLSDLVFKILINDYSDENETPD